MRTLTRSAAVLALVVLGALVASAAFAAEANPQCVAQATGDFLLCRQQCREAYQVGKDMCRNIDHDCAESCRAGLDACLDGPNGPLTQLETCRMGCGDALETAVQACREQFGVG